MIRGARMYDPGQIPAVIILKRFNNKLIIFWPGIFQNQLKFLMFFPTFFPEFFAKILLFFLEKNMIFFPKNIFILIKKVLERAKWDIFYLKSCSLMSNVWREISTFRSFKLAVFVKFGCAHWDSQPKWHFLIFQHSIPKHRHLAPGELLSYEFHFEIGNFWDKENLLYLREKELTSEKIAFCECFLKELNLFEQKKSKKKIRKHGMCQNHNGGW